jgi:imidazolonepropionase-like amidohydrolase
MKTNVTIPQHVRHLICALLLSCNAFAQQFSPSVKQFITVSADTVILTHAKIVDGTGGSAKANQTIVIVKGRIAQVGSSTGISTSSGKTIDCTGKTIIPGMIMMHEHLFYGESLPPNYLGLEMPLSFPKLYLAGGATTIRTTGTVEPQTDLNLNNWIAQGKMVGPDIDVTAPYIEREFLPIPEVHFIKSPDEAAADVSYWISKGCTSFKVYMDITRDDLKKVVAVAHQNNLKVTGHLCSVTYREAASNGIDNLEHGFVPCSDFVTDRKEDVCAFGAVTPSLKKLDVNSAEMKDLMKFLIDKKVAITSTLPVFETYTNREVFPGGGDVAVAPQIKEAVEKGYNAFVGKDSSDAAFFKKEMAWEKQFVDMGGRLMAGVDPTGAGRTIPGYADRHVFELLVEAGFTFPQAVKICSLNAAEYLGRDKEIGTIAVGKRADLVLINGDPEKQIKDVRNTEIVFKNGVGFDSKKIFDSVNGKVGLY